jgi:hypothetical protein
VHDSIAPGLTLVHAPFSPALFTMGCAPGYKDFVLPEHKIILAGIIFSDC